ncbi:MAG: DUF423 domain-containing protein [Verrucomicrobia bacterium]|nr:DUF423 domain-containing protein [Verrucomicrobiota bacterium]
MNSQTALRISAIVGFLAVALGAFGAHGLHAVLEKNARLATWETAVLYHLTHAVVLLIIATLRPLRAAAFWLMLTGIAIFSGTLYVLALTNVKWLGAITPIGGVCLLAGWLTLGFGKPDSKSAT